jgi:hypothetical protein
LDLLAAAAVDAIAGPADRPAGSDPAEAQRAGGATASRASLFAISHQASLAAAAND